MNERRQAACGRRTVLAGMTLLALTGCGWHLRGRQKVPFDTIYIALDDNSEAYATLKRNLEAQTNLKVVKEEKEADATLHWFNSTRSESVVAVNTKGRARLYDLRQSITFRVNLKGGGTLIPNTVLSTTRELNWDEQDWNARESESRMLYREMEQNLMARVVNRLAHITPEMVEKSARGIE